MKSPIYTMAGDQGRTSTLCGQRVLKHHPQVQAYGAIDELNSALGLALAHMKTDVHKSMPEVLKDLQHQLFYLGAHMATQREVKSLPPLQKQWIQKLEQHIDQWDAEMPKLRHFILPQGGLVAVHLHYARTVCRRAESLCVAGLHAPQLDSSKQAAAEDCPALQKNATTSSEATQERHLFIVKFLNRLSDFLFVAARYSNFLNNYKEKIWAPSCN